MSRHLERAQLLIEQSRYGQAIEELQLELAQEPDGPLVHALLAVCLAESKQYPEATQHAQTAVQIAPDLPYPYFALANVLRQRNRMPEATAAIAEAIRLDPLNADYFGMLAGIRFEESRWTDALDAATQGLAVDAEDVVCTNLRAMALVKLGRREQAGATIDAALARDPENAVTHANQGWTFLEKGKPKEALHHFREALRLNPDLDWARAGIVEALKSRNLIYRLMLGYFLWMAKLSSRAQWGIVIGGYFGYQFLSGLAKSNPAISPYITPLLIAYAVFALMTWMADPLFNLLLRIDKFGRYVLSPEQIRAANLVGSSLGAALVCLIILLIHGGPLEFIGMLYFAGLIMPLSAIYRCSQGWPRKGMGLFTITLAAVGITPLLLIAFGSLIPEQMAWFFEGAYGNCTSAFFLGVIASPWVANLLVGSNPRH